MLRLCRGLAAWTLGTFLLIASGVAAAHAERQAFFPNPPFDPNNPDAPVRHERPVYRPLLPAPQSPRKVVCKKSTDAGVRTGEDSASRIAAMPAGALKTVNQQLLAECGFQHLQAAVDAVSVRGTTIYVLPGVYREQPSIQALEENFGAAVPADRDFCQAVVQRGPGKLSYEEQYRCRFIQNTVAIFGDPNFSDDNCGDDPNGVCTNPQTQRCEGGPTICKYYDLQVEGTGDDITDVVFEGSFIDQPGDAADGQFKYLNGIRADRADGIFLSNFTTQIYEFNAVYVMETDGYVFDRLLSRWVDEYAFLSFASDHGLYDYTEGYGVADSVQYPGSGADVYKGLSHAQANLRQRQATEVRNSKGHHSALGYSGTAGNAPWVHDNDFYKNQTGMATESVFGGHPGMPQDHALWEDNRVYANNKDYYKLVTEDGPCVTKTPRDRGVVPAEFNYFDQLPADYQEALMDRTVVCPPIPFPTGTGMIIAGGNYDVISENQIFDNWRQGLWLLSMPTLIHQISGEAPEPTPDAFTLPFFTSHFLRVQDNRFGESTLQSASLSQPNGVDIWWDNSGTGSCFTGNSSKQGDVTADLGPLGVQGLPTECGDGGDPGTIDQVTTARPDRIVQFGTCLQYSRTDPDSKAGCPFFDEISPPAGRVGSANRVSSTDPVAAARATGGATLGYFVLHNDSNSTHRLEQVTARATGPVASVGAVRLSISDIRGNTFTAPGTRTGDTITFSFATPVDVPVGEATLVRLERAASSVALAAPDAGRFLLLASLGVTGIGGLLLGLFGNLRRLGRALVAAGLLAFGLAGCGGGSDDDDGTGGGGGGSAQSVTFSLTDLQFEGDPADADYAGLPLTIGTVTLP